MLIVISRKVLEDGGSAMDSAIATLLCMSIVIPESTGLGGGSFINYYHKCVFLSSKAANSN